MADQFKILIVLIFCVSVLLNIYFLLSMTSQCKQGEVSRSEYTPLTVPLLKSKESKTEFLVVAIMSAPGNINRRNIVRDTWLGRSKHARFIIGTKNLSTTLIQSLENEQTLHNDLLLLEDFEDHYKKLSHKVLATLVWFDSTMSFKYLLKCDDDSFVLLDRMEKALKKRNHTRDLYWGYFVGNNNPKLTGQWAETNWRFCDLYFPYAYGGGYVLSANIVRHIAKNSDSMIVYSNEDVSVGAWTVVYEMERWHDVRFDTYGKSRGCRNDFIVTHKQSVKEMRQKHKLYKATGKLCLKEHVEWEDEYNWNVPPSKCYT